MDAAEEQQVVAAVRVEGKVLHPDAVVDRRRIAQVRAAVGVADRDIVDAILVRLEGGQDAFRGEAVDRRHDRRLHQPREGERHEVGLVVNEVELARALEDMGDVQHLPHLGVDGRVLGIGRRADAAQLARRQAVLGGEQGDVDAARHQRLGQQARHQLPGTIVARRGAPGDRREHGDTQAIVLPCFRQSDVRITPSFPRSRRAPCPGCAASARVDKSGRPSLAQSGNCRRCGRVPKIERHDQSLRTVPALIGEDVALRIQQREARRSTAPDTLRRIASSRR